jgi:16S rRNA processing protein RimM
MSERAPQSSALIVDGQVWPEDAVEVGRIVDAWGVKGGIKVQPFSSDPQALFCTKKWFVLPAETAPGAVVRPAARVGSTSPARLSAPRFLQMKQVREQGDIVVGTAEGLDDRSGAEALRGSRVFVSRSAFPTPDDNEFYWIDLIGLDVFTPDGQSLGRVVDLMDTGPHCVLRCVFEPAPASPVESLVVAEPQADAQPLKGKKPKTPPEPINERLIPFVDAYIVSVSLSDRRIVADWGLDY